MKISLETGNLQRKENIIRNYITNQYPNDAAKVYAQKISEKAPVDSGKLRDSFFVSNSKIFSKVPYAAIQNYGGRIRITNRMRRKMWALYYQTGEEIYKNIAITRKRYIEMPAQNYVSKVKKFIRELKRTLLYNLNKKLR